MQPDSQLPHEVVRSTEARRKASILASGRLTAVSVLDAYLETRAVSGEISRYVDGMASSVAQGDLQCLERMLLEQAVATNAMFTGLAVRAASCSDRESTTTLTNLALKAQANSRTTLQALVDVKAPRQVAYVRQTNLATHQQVNTVVGIDPMAGRLENAPPNELIVPEPSHGRQAVDRSAKG